MFSKFQSLPSYFGGKRKLVKYIFKPIKKKDGVFIDAFLGGGSVSLYAKAKGYKVISNDIAYRSLIIGKAIIANNSVKLESEDLARLFIETKHDGFIKKNYSRKFSPLRSQTFSTMPWRPPDKWKMKPSDTCFCTLSSNSFCRADSSESSRTPGTRWTWKLASGSGHCDPSLMPRKTCG